MIWRFWKRTPQRRAHTSPPLRVVLAERDEARGKVRELGWRLLREREDHRKARQEIYRLRDQNAYLRGRVALLENACSVSVPAPMDMAPFPKEPHRPSGSARVIPLHKAPLGGRRA